MKMKTINDLLLYGEKELNNIETSQLDANLLLASLLKEDKLYLFMNKNKELDDVKIEEYKKCISRRKSGEPLQYITNYQEFMGLDFFVESGVLIPRGDTEVLVEVLIDRFKECKEFEALDIGTGSGAIHIALASYLKQGKFTTVDISLKAIEIAKKNAKNNNVLDRITYVESDLFENIDEEKTFDLIVSNPPYIPTDVIDDLQVEVAIHEPKIALDGGIDGYDFYRKITKESKKYLKEEGVLAFEVGHDQSGEIKRLMLDCGYIEIEIYKDLNNIERVVIAKKGK